MNKDPWYREWFGEEYLQLYPHRDGEEAERAVNLFLSHLSLDASARILDVGCGSGRHLRAMADRGYAPMGLDLSLPLLRRAGASGVDVPLLRGDMRLLPFQDATFDLVTSFFTSFGYFAREAENLSVLQGFRRVLRPGGHALVDYLNARAVRDNLTPRDVRRIGSREVIQERRLVEEGRVVEKTILIRDGGEGPPREFRERVRLYDAAEMEELLARAGFDLQRTMGDYDGAPAGPSSPRLILLARAG